MKSLQETETAAVIDTAVPVGLRADPSSVVTRLFARDGLSLYRFCRSMLHGSGDAEDVVQDTFVKLLQHLRADGDRSNLRAWLFAVAANACRDRARAGMRWLPWRAELDRRTVPAVEPREPAAATSDHRRARAALDALAPRDRMLLSLRAQGLSYREVAVATGIAEKSVGRLLARAVARWKKNIDT